MPDRKNHRSKPEIIPPHEQTGRPGHDQPRVHVFVNTDGTERIYVAKPGPFGTVLMVLIAGMLAAIFVIFFFAAFFFLLPFMILLLAIAVVVGLLRALFWGEP